MSSNNRKTTSDSRPKQILFVWNYLEWGGVQTYFLGLMRSVSPEYGVKAVLPKGSDAKILRYLEAADAEYDLYEGKIDLSAAFKPVQKIKRRFNDLLANLSLAKQLSKYDLKNSVVQIDVAPWTGFGLLLFLVWQAKVFVTLHTAVSETSFLRGFLWKIKLAVLGGFQNFYLNASNLDVKKSLRPLLSKSRYRQMEVIYSSFNAQEFASALKEPPTKKEITDKYNFPADKMWLCSVGQFIERKGCWILLEAVQMLQKRRDDLFFCWLGTSPLDAATLEKINNFEVKSNFRFLSAEEIGANRRDLLTLWNAADIFLLPSFQEGLPMALVEAMALGKAS